MSVFIFHKILLSKPVYRSFSIIKVSLKISQNSQKTIYAGVSFPMKFKVAG